MECGWSQGPEKWTFKEGIDLYLIERSRMIEQKNEISNFNENSKFLVCFLGLRPFLESGYQLKDPFASSPMYWGKIAQIF